MPGDQVQLTDPKGRQHRLVLTAGRTFHTHRGAVAHDDLIGQPEGSLVMSAGGTPYIALRPLLADYTLSMSRGAAVIYPKDAAQIIAMADIFPGATVVEAGAGSGALSCWLLRAVGEEGRLISYERRPDFAEIARANVEQFFGGPHPAWRLIVGDLPGGPRPPDEPADGRITEADRFLLDMLAPWEYARTAAAALIPGGLVCCYVATSTDWRYGPSIAWWGTRVFSLPQEDWPTGSRPRRAAGVPPRAPRRRMTWPNSRTGRCSRIGNAAALFPDRNGETESRDRREVTERPWIGR